MRKQSGRKLGRREINTRKDRESEKAFQRDVCCRDSGIGGDRHDIGSPRGAKIKATLHAPLLESMHKVMAASRQ